MDYTSPPLPGREKKHKFFSLSGFLRLKGEKILLHHGGGSG